MAKQPTTVNADTPPVRTPDGKHVNSTALVFPLDETGFTSMLRKEGVRAVGRIGGDPARMAIFKATLRVLAEHAGVKLVHQQTVRKQDIARAEKIVEAEAARAETDRVREIARLRGQAEALEATIAGKVAEAPNAE